ARAEQSFTHSCRTATHPGREHIGKRDLVRAKRGDEKRSRRTAAGSSNREGPNRVDRSHSMSRRWPPSVMIVKAYQGLKILKNLLPQTNLAAPAQLDLDRRSAQRRSQ